MGCLVPYNLFSCFFSQENRLSKGSYPAQLGLLFTGEHSFVSPGLIPFVQFSMIPPVLCGKEL